MSAETETPTATAVTAKAAPKADALGDLPAHLKASLELRRRDRAMAAAIANESWGKKLDAETRAAIAGYCQKYGIDVTEIDVLGGQLYRNARFYFSRLAALHRAGLIEYAYADHIAADPRLVEDAKSADPELARIAQDEFVRRRAARTEFAVPEDAVAACVFRVKTKGAVRETTGCKWIPAKVENDPVGKSRPVETVESRAARRCLRQLISNIPAPVGDVLTAIEAEFEVLESKVAPRLAAAEKADLDKPAAMLIAGDVQFRPAGGGAPLASGGYDETPRD